MIFYLLLDKADTVFQNARVTHLEKNVYIIFQFFFALNSL